MLNVGAKNTEGERERERDMGKDKSLKVERRGVVFPSSRIALQPQVLYTPSAALDNKQLA